VPLLRVESFELGPLATNAYLIWNPDTMRAVVVDPGMDPGPLLSRLEPFHVEAVVLTHAHFDHIGGVEDVRRLKRCPVYVHSAEADWLTDGRLNGSLWWPELGGEIRVEPADGFLEDGRRYEWIGETFEVYHTPGHSPGGVSIRCGNRLFCGDVLFRRSVGRTDLPGGDWDSLVRSVRDVLFRLPDDVVVYPGHGPSTTIGEEKADNPYVGAGA